MPEESIVMTHLSESYRIGSYIDTYALGHYARVLEATDKRHDRTVAFKVMRPEHLLADGEMRWEFRAFGSEAAILTALKDSPHVVNCLDCGFVATIAEAPADGEIVSFGTDTTQFQRHLSEYAQKGWRPYLTLDYLPRVENLFYSMKPTRNQTRRRLPSEEGITLALQFANVLSLAHQHQIVYLDHKLEHVYWNGVNLTVIDFNSSKQLKGDVQDAQEYAKDVHNLCVGILYPLFTGMAPQKTSLRPQPGDLETVSQRYDDVSELDFIMEPSLSRALQNLLQRGAAMQIATVDEFMTELKEVAALHGRDFPVRSTTPASRQARDNMRRGLKQLREGELAIREARDLFREALILDGITGDLEDELRRLVKEVNELLNHRVIP
jgi:serine/threonine protein kinase